MAHQSHASVESLVMTSQRASSPRLVTRTLPSARPGQPLPSQGAVCACPRCARDACTARPCRAPRSRESDDKDRAQGTKLRPRAAPQLSATAVLCLLSGRSSTHVHSHHECPGTRQLSTGHEVLRVSAHLIGRDELLVLPQGGSTEAPLSNRTDARIVSVIDLAHRVLGTLRIDAVFSLETASCPCAQASPRKSGSD